MGDPKPSTLLPPGTAVGCKGCAIACSARSFCRRSHYRHWQEPFGGCCRSHFRTHNCCRTKVAVPSKSHSVPVQEPDSTAAVAEAPDDSEQVPVQPMDPGWQEQARRDRLVPAVAQERRLEQVQELVVAVRQMDRKKPKMLPKMSSLQPEEEQNS